MLSQPKPYHTHYVPGIREKDKASNCALIAGFLVISWHIPLCLAVGLKKRFPTQTTASEALLIVGAINYGEHDAGALI